jgi:hypothetical protein
MKDQFFACFRCEMFDKCCKEQAKLEDCQQFDMIDCKKLVCKVSNCTIALTTVAPLKGSISGAPARVQLCIGALLFARELNKIPIKSDNY